MELLVQNSKFGSSGGRLAEPSATLELYTLLYSTATSIVNSGPYWIGIDDLQYNDGVFRYASDLSGIGYGVSNYNIQN